MAGEAIFLKLDGIPGESTSKAFDKQIEVSSFQWGVSNGAAVGGRGASQPTADDIVITKTIDASSALLLGACLSGKVVKTGVFTFEKDRSTKAAAEVKFLQIKLTNVLVSSYDIGDASGANNAPTDRVSFSFQKIEFDYTPLGAATITTVWQPIPGEGTPDR